MKRTELKNEYLAGKLVKAEYLQKINDLHKVLEEYSEFITGSEIDEIIITKDGVKYKNNNGLVFGNDIHDEHLPPKIAMNMNHYEQAELAMMDKLIELSEAKTIFDIGANIGWMTLHFIRKHPNSKILSFEPVPETYKKLMGNFALNKTEATNVYNFAFGDEEGKVEFFFYPEGSGGASLADNSRRDSVKKVTCQIKKMDDFCKETLIFPDFIKCDVEGAELFVYRGGLKTIEKYKPIIFSEMLRKWSASFNYHPNAIIDMLTEIGYDCFFIENDNLIRISQVTDETLQTNFIFLNREKHSETINKLVI